MKQKGGWLMPDFPVQMVTRVIRLGPNQTIYYPQIFHLKSPVVQYLINQAITRGTQSLIQKQTAERPNSVVEMLGTYEIKNNQRNILSLTLANYTYHEQAAHGMTYLSSLTFDLTSGQKYTLNQLFKPESHYIARLSSLILKQISERNIPLLTDFVKIRPDQDFYIADKTLVIFFQLYEITPYVYGFPMFPVSVYELEDIIDENAPLAKMLAN